MSYDQDEALVVDEAAIDRLALKVAAWAKLFAVRTQALDRRYKPFGEIEFTLLAVTRRVDAVDRSRTTFKPYGHEVFQEQNPDQTFFHRDRLPSEGLFQHSSGASTSILTFDDDTHPELSFKRIYVDSGLIGLRFVQMGQV